MVTNVDSDTDALIQRERINKSARYDLDEWIFRQIRLDSGIKVLDLGCGTGKQIFALRKLLSSDSMITGVDISAAAVAKVNERAKGEELQNIKAAVCEHEGVVNHFKGACFDLIMSSYAIYYAKDMIELLSSLSSLLNRKGQVFVCGYGQGTNQEMHEIIKVFCAPNHHITEFEDDFISENEIVDIARNYSSYQVVRLPNQIYFDSPDSLLIWWKNHNLYVPEILQQVCDAIDQHFRVNGSFTLTKNVIGIRFDAK